MNIAVIGSYWQKYSRNRALVEGLRSSGANVTEYNYVIEPEKMNEAGDLGFVRVLKRAWQLITSSAFVISKTKTLSKADVIMCLYPGHLDLATAWLIAKIVNKPLVFDGCISLYDSLVIDKKVIQPNSLTAKLLLYLERILLTLPDLILTDTVSMGKFNTEKLNVPTEKLAIIPLGANDHIYKKSSKKTTNRKTQVFFFGLYNPLQGTQYIAQAAKYLKNRKDIEIVMLGEGPDRAEAENIVKNNKLSNISFIGFVPEKELVSHIQDCDIMLGIFADTHIAKRVVPNKVFAGLACGKAVITANHPPINDFFTHKENMYVCKPNDPKSLSQAIIELADDKELRESIADNGYKLFKREFSSKVLGTKIMSELEMQLENKRGSYAKI